MCPRSILHSTDRKLRSTLCPFWRIKEFSSSSISKSSTSFGLPFVYTKDFLNLLQPSALEDKSLLTVKTKKIFKVTTYCWDMKLFQTELIIQFHTIRVEKLKFLTCELVSWVHLTCPCLHCYAQISYCFACDSSSNINISRKWIS